MKKILFIVLSLFVSVSFAKSKPLTVILDWFPNPDHAPLIIAEQQGFFKEEGLTVELIGPADPTDPPKWIAAQKADIGITYQPEFMEQVDQGLPLVRIGTLIDRPLNCIVALNNNGNGIKTLSDLRGKLVGSSLSGLSGIMLKVMLSQQGLTERDIQLVNVKYNLTQALLSRKVDAVTGMMRNFEVPLLESKGYKVAAFFPEEHGIPNYSELIFIANKENKYDSRFPRFIAAIKKAVAYLDAHPQESWDLFIKQYPEANNTVNHAAWFATMPYFAEEPAEFDKEEWLRFGQFMQENGLIKKVLPISRYAIVV